MWKCGVINERNEFKGTCPTRTNENRETLLAFYIIDTYLVKTVELFGCKTHNLYIIHTLVIEVITFIIVNRCHDVKISRLILIP